MSRAFILVLDSVGIGSAPSWARRRFTSSVASASRSTLLSFSTIGRGVPAGATMP